MNKKFQTSRVTEISITHLIHDIYPAFLAPILPILIDRFGISIFLAGLLEIVRKIPSLLNPLTGVISDKIVLRMVIIPAPFITAVCMTLLGVAPSYTTVLILILISGISSSLYHVPAPVLIKRYSGNKIGRGMSFFMLGGEMARTLGPIIVLGTISMWGFEKIYRLIPLGLFASIFLYIRLKDTVVKKYPIQQNRNAFSQKSKLYVPFFLYIAGFSFFRSAAKMSLTIFLPTYLTSKGVSLWSAGISLAILQFSGAVGTIFAGHLSDKIGRKRILLTSAFLVPILMYLFITSNNIFAIPLLIITGFFMFASSPVMLALIHDIKSENMAFLNGVYMTTNSISGTITALFIGLGADKFGLDITFMIATIMTIFAIPFVFFIDTAFRKINSH